MARYFFDIDDGKTHSVDDIGVEIRDRKQIEIQAVEVLPDIAREELPSDLEREFTVRVRDSTGKPIFHASLILKAKWLD